MRFSEAASTLTAKGSMLDVYKRQGLGGKVYRSGDYDYYINETIRNNDPKAVGPFIMASFINIIVIIAGTIYLSSDVYKRQVQGPGCW